jgi:hypothetical protein
LKTSHNILSKAKGLKKCPGDFYLSSEDLDPQIKFNKKMSESYTKAKED